MICLRGEQLFLAGEMNDVQTYNGDMILSLLLCVYVLLLCLCMCCCYACCYRSYRRYPFCHEMTRWCWLGFRCQKSVAVHSSVSGSSSCCCFECLVCFYCPVHVVGRIRTKTVVVDGSRGHNSIRFSCEIINGRVNDILSPSVLLCARQV